MTAEDIQCTLTAVAPNNLLNVMGGDNITFTGTFLPRDLSKSEVIITFDDSQSTSCIPKVSATNELVCETASFADTELDTLLNPTVLINAKTVTHS
jgi:hypothetical protein